MTFRKLDLSPSSGEGGGGKTPTQLGPLERANLNHWTIPVRFTEHGMAMGSSLSPIVSNIFMENFEKLPLELAQHKPSLWLQYIDDTFVVWPHCQERLQDFLSHLNSLRRPSSAPWRWSQTMRLPILMVWSSGKRQH
jgi:hypothetical protein